MIFKEGPRSSSRPRTPAFHVGNGGSNPPGDAKINHGISKSANPFFYPGPKGATTLVVSGLFFFRCVRAVISGSLILTLVSQKFVDFTYQVNTVDHIQESMITS